MAARSSSKLAGDLVKHEHRLVEAKAEQSRIAAALGQVAAVRDQAADAELANDLAAANRLRAEAKKLEGDALAREGELVALVSRAETLIEKTKQAIERAAFSEALSARDEKAKQAAKVAGEIASALKRPLELARKLEQLRAEIDALDTQARELAKPLDIGVEPFEDEPTFGDQAALDLLQAGARQLNAATKAEAVREAEKWAIERPERIERAVRSEMQSMIPTRVNGKRRLGPIERLGSEELRRDAIDAYAKAAKRAPERARPSYEQRLKELREFAEGPAEETDGNAEAEHDDRSLRLLAS